MKIKDGISIALIILLSVTFIGLGIYSAREYRSAKDREARSALLQKELQKADAIPDDGAAATAYKKLRPALPEIQLRILQRQWRLALELVQYMQRARNNSELRNGTDLSSARLKSLLDEMQDRCGSMLAEGASLRPDIGWQVSNISGSTKVLSALMMLESEQNPDKVQGVMREALADYKAAIESVDKAGLSPLQKNIPRWNFELLNGEKYVQKFEVAMTDTDKNQALKENLETLIPEMGGYAAGEPIDTRVKK